MRLGIYYHPITLELVEVTRYDKYVFFGLTLETAYGEPLYYSQLHFKTVFKYLGEV